MRIKVLAENLARECLSDLTAGDLMTEPPISLRADASIPEALIFFTTRGYHAAPVINDAGYPVGVISVTDLLRHDLDRGSHPSHEIERRSGCPIPNGFEIEEVDEACVEDVMTNAVFTISTDTKLPTLINQLLHLNVHQLYVVNQSGLLIGVLSTTDIIKVLSHMLS